MEILTSESWQYKCVVLVTLLNDWNNGGPRRPLLKDMRSGKVMQDEAYLVDTVDARMDLAHNARYSDFAVFNYGDVLVNKGKAKELYRVTRDDYRAYMALPDGD